MNQNNLEGFSEIEKEQAKRERHLSDKQRQIWADGLLARLTESKAYQEYCTPEARLREQKKLLQFLEDWKSKSNGSAAT